MQSRVERVEDGQLHLAQVDADTQPEAGSDSALLAAGHPTVTALDSVRGIRAGLAGVAGVRRATHRLRKRTE